MPVPHALSGRIAALALLASSLIPAHAQAPAEAPAAAPAPPVAAPVPGVAAPAPLVLPPRGTFKITGDARQLSVFAVAVDAQELFTALADKGNLRLIVDDTIVRRITANITNRGARQLIEDVASAYGLAVADVDGVTMISEGIPRSASSYLLSDIDFIPTKYVDAANARNLLPVFLQDYVKVNSEQNAVVLSAPTEVLAKFRSDIAQFDIPASQILIELLVVELTDTTADQLAATLNWQNDGRGVFVGASAGSVIYRESKGLVNQLTATLQALKEQGKARVRANPRIATVSGRRASIFVGRQRYVATPIDSGGGQRNFIDAGVRLGITPYTGGQGQVLVDVDSEVSTLSAPDPVTNLPEKSTRTARTTVRVNDGQTIIIGGLRQQESRNVRTRIPLLGDIPLLGPLLFRSKVERTTQTELALFITPRVLSTTGHLPEDEEKALRQRFLDGDLNQPLPPPALPMGSPFGPNDGVLTPTPTTPAAAMTPLVTPAVDPAPDEP